MSDDLRERVARAIKAAFAEHTEIAILSDAVADAMADAALAEIFRSDGNEESRWIEACENACLACGGSGHKDDAAFAETGEPAPVSVREAARVLLGIVERREWSHYPIEMPLTINGNGPAKVGRDAHCMTYEVWEADTLRSISDHNKLPDAIGAWLRAIAEGKE